MTQLAYILELMTLRRMGIVYFFVSPFFIIQGDDIPTILIYCVGYLFALPVVLVGISAGIMRMFQPFSIDKTTFALAGLVLIAMASVAVNSPDYLLSPVWLFSVLFKFLVPMSAFFIARNTLNESDLPLLQTLMLGLGMVGFLAMLVVLPYNLLTKTAFELRYSFFFHDSNFYCLFTNIIFGMTFPTFLRRRMSGEKAYGWAAAGILLAIQVFASGSRGGALALIFIVIVSVLATRDWNLIRKFMIVTLVMMITAGVLMAFRYAMTKAQYSDLARLLTYRLGLNILHDKPLLGVGLGNTLAAYDNYGIGFAAMIGHKLVIHNAALGIAAEIGVFGAFCYLLFLTIPASILFRRILKFSKRFYPYVEISALNVLMAVFVADMFLPYELLYDSFWMYLTFPFIVLRSKNENDRLMLGIMFSEARKPDAPAQGAAGRLEIG